MSFDLAGKRVWVAGHTGMAGSAIVRRLAREDCELLTVTRDVVDLTRQSEVEDWMADMRPQAVFLAAGRVGGIMANSTYPADFLYDNLAIVSNVIEGAHKSDVEKLLFLGSSCIYPKLAAQPIVEEALLSGPLEPTNEWYAIAKIAGVKLCQAYRRQHGRNFLSAMPTNLYGPGDNFDPQGSHVIAALMRRLHESKERGDPECVIWGSGTPRREFLFADDLADACVFLMRHFDEAGPINVGSGEEVSIMELAHMLKAVVGFEGDLVYDRSKPDGTPRKFLDTQRMRQMGWRPSMRFADGLPIAYEWFLNNVADKRIGR